MCKKILKLSFVIFVFIFLWCEKIKEEKEVFTPDTLIETGEVKQILKPFAKPHYVLSSNGYIFVTNPDISYGENYEVIYGEGFLTVIKEDNLQVVNIIKTSHKNPTHIAVYGNELYVVNTGEYYYDNEKKLMFPKTDGSIDIINLSEVENIEKVSNSIPITLSKKNPLVGAPGGISIITQGGKVYAYIGSGTSGVVFKIDLNSKKLINGSENPIQIVKKEGNQMTYPFAYPKGFISVLSFNTDEIYVLNPNGDILNPSPYELPIAVGKSPEMEGPIHAAWRTDKKYPDLFVLLSISNSITSVDTRYAPYSGINPDFMVTGVAPNRIYFFENLLFVVNSFSNNIQMIDLQTKKNYNPFIVLPEKSNPYDMAISMRKGVLTGYITAFESNSLFVVNLKERKIIAEIK